MGRVRVRGGRGAWLVVAVACAAAQVACTKKLKGVSSVEAGADASAFVDAGAGDGAASDDGGSAPTSATADGAMPPAGSDELNARMRHLLEAIAQNNPDLASDVLFPRDAWIASKDDADPARSWEKRAKTPFGRSVERLHKRVKNVDRARFVSFALGQAVLQVQPKKHDLKKALWRVRHSKLLLSVDGKPQSIEIAEMTSWRGAWYVTKLR